MISIGQLHLPLKPQCKYNILYRAIKVLFELSRIFGISFTRRLLPNALTNRRAMYMFGTVSCSKLKPTMFM